MKKAAITSTAVAATAVLVMAALLMTAAVEEPVSWHGTHLSPPMPATPFTLRAGDGPVSLADLEGKAVVLFFGFTSCPDVCPTTLLRLDQALDELDERGGPRDDVQVVFVSVDPARDSPERTSEYARAIDPSFIGVSGTEEEIAEVAAAYGIYHARAEGSHDHTGYMVDHTTTVSVLNPEGERELLWSSTVTSRQMAEDLANLLDG